MPLILPDDDELVLLISSVPPLALIVVAPLYMLLLVSFRVPLPPLVSPAVPPPLLTIAPVIVAVFAFTLIVRVAAFRSMPF